MAEETEVDSKHTLNKTRMILTAKAQRLAYVLRGKNRRAVYQALLDNSRTLSEISIKTGIPISNVSRVINQLEQETLVENVTPFQKIGALYNLTNLALEFKPEFEEHMKFRENSCKN